MGRRAISTTTQTVERTTTIARTTAVETITAWRTTHQDHYISIHPPPGTITITSYERTLTIPPSRETIYNPFPKSFETLVYNNNATIQTIQSLTYIGIGISIILFVCFFWLLWRGKQSNTKQLKQF